MDSRGRVCVFVWVILTFVGSAVKEGGRGRNRTIGEEDDW